LPKPLILAKPAKFTDLRWAYFTFSTKLHGARFECSLDGAPFRPCPNHVVYGLIEGHRKLGKVCKRAGRHGRSHRRPKRCGAKPRRARRHLARARHPRHTMVCRQPRRRHQRRCVKAFIVGAGRPLRFGTHTFRVRVQGKGKRGKIGPPAVYTWTILTKAQLEARRREEARANGRGQGGGSGSGGGGGGPTGSASQGGGENVVPIVRARNFLISGSPDGLLYPGGPALTIPLHIFNPNPQPIVVTSITVSVAGNPPGCSAEENLRLTQSNASTAQPLRVAPGETVVLPAQGVTAPTIQFLDLPVNQDACQNATFPLLYSGSAHA